MIRRIGERRAARYRPDSYSRSEVGAAWCSGCVRSVPSPSYLRVPTAALRAWIAHLLAF